MKDMLTEIKNNLQGKNSRMDEAKNQINDLEHKEEKKKTNQNKKKEKSIQKNEDTISSLWDNFKSINIHIMSMLEEEMEQESGNLFEKMTENFPNLVKEIDIQVWEAPSPKQDEPTEGHSKTHHN